MNLRFRTAWLGTVGLGASALLRASFSADEGSGQFYRLSSGLAGTLAVGALGAGPVPWHGSSIRSRDAVVDLVVVPAVTGAATFAVFYGAARVACKFRPLRRHIASVFRYADEGATPAILLLAASGGVAEELYYRGALWSGKRPLTTTTVAYSASTAAAGNPMLVLAGVIISVVFGWQRQVTGGVVAPAVSHVTWSMLMLRFLPPLFRDQKPRDAGSQPVEPIAASEAAAK